MLQGAPFPAGVEGRLEERVIAKGGRWLKELINLSSLGLTLVIATMIGFGLGVYVDHKFHTNRGGSLGGLLLGLASGFYTLVKESLKGMRKAEREDERAKDGAGENGA